MKENTFSEITDIDSKLMKTMAGLIVGPIRVVNDDTDSFTSPLRYALTLAGLFFVLTIFIDSLLFKEALQSNSWMTPLRMQEFYKQSENVLENFSSLIAILSIIPGVWLFNKLLFYKKGSFKFFYRITLYLVGQLSIVWFLIYVVTSIVPMMDFTIPGLSLFFAYIGYFYLNLRLNKWWLAIPKMLLIVMVGLLGFSSFSPFLDIAFINLFVHPDKHYEMEISDNDLFIDRKAIDEEVMGLEEIIKGSKYDFFIDEYGWQFGALDKTDHQLIWEQFTYFDSDYDVVYHQLLDVPEHQMVIAIGDTLFEIDQRKETFLKVYDYDGKDLFSHSFKAELVSEAFYTHNSNSASLELLVPYDKASSTPYLFRVADISIANQNVTMIDSIRFADPVQSIYRQVDGSSIVSIVEKPQWHYVSFQIAKYDAQNELVWRKTTYDKHSPYDPRIQQLIEIDNEANEVIVHYSLANDTTDFAYFKSFDLNSGELNWENQVWIPGDFTEYMAMIIDDDYIYISGETHRDIVNAFWQPQFHIGTIAKVNRKNGELVSYKHIGHKGPNSHTRISVIDQTENNLILYGVQLEHNYLQLGFDENRYTFKWVMAKDNL